MRTHDQYNGVFLLQDREFSGQLSIAGPETVAKIVGKDFWPSVEEGFLDIHGMLGDGRKASLLNCVQDGRTQYRFDESAQFESRFFPNHVVVGEEFIRSDEAVIRAVRYHFSNVGSLVGGHKTFDYFHASPELLRRFLEEAGRQPGSGPESSRVTSEIGDDPVVMYFSGVWEIIGLETDVGRISLTNRTCGGPGTAEGVGIQNEVTVNIEFSCVNKIGDAIRYLYTLHSLFEVCLGYRQRYKWIELELTHRERYGKHEMYQTARLYWSLCNQRVERDGAANRHDALLAPDRRPEEFAKVVAGWMGSAKTMGDPRERFATAFFGDFGINRIVGAANMFDLLPEDRAPRKFAPDAQLLAATEECRKIFRQLPDSPPKQSVLSALGRVGTSSLRDKVRHRASKVITGTGSKFIDIYLPCDQAVLARNHYVHGSPAEFSYLECFTEFAFITETLEFVFAVSDLLDLGWDFGEWIGHGTTRTHAFGAYVVNFPENMRRLKRVIGK